MKPAFRFDQRACGLLLHPTSLPGNGGSGDLGPAAYRFVDFMADAGQRWWQMLPTNPPGLGYSPYSPLSAFAGGPHLISLDRLKQEGLLKSADLRPVAGLRDERVVFGTTMRYRLARLRRAFVRFADLGGLTDPEFKHYCQQQGGWLDNWALFATLKRRNHGKAWFEWPRALRLASRAELRQLRRDFAGELDFERFCQFEFDRQWAALRAYASKRGVGLVGDLPIFVATDSADVWGSPELFALDAQRRPKIVTGVPPDYFSKDGQLWNHPHYAWPRHRRTRWAWWIARCRRLVEQFDGARIDHFLGFCRLWAVPGRAKTARRGKWIPTPGDELLSAVTRALGRVEIIAEDLGLVTPQAVKLREKFGYPGMRLLLNAFWGEQFYDEPHAHPPDCVVYTGTHDNETALGWFQRIKREAKRQRRARGGLSQYDRLLRYVGTDGHEICWDLIRAAYISSANTAIIPVQDVLQLDNAARMNVPGKPTGNWTWRLPAKSLTARLARRLRGLSEAYDRVRPLPSTTKRRH